MEFETFLNKDITVHTDTHTYRGVLVQVVRGVLVFKAGIDDFYIDCHKIVAITAHGREFGKENIEDGTE
jgi:hypothetical protein